MIPAIAMSLGRAFRSFGVSVEEMDLREVAKRPETLWSWPQRKTMEALVTVDLGGPEALPWEISDIQEEMRIPWLVWFVDDPMGYGLLERCDPAWTMVFCWDKLLFRDLAARGSFEVWHLPLAADPDMLPQAKSSKASAWDFPGIFIGSVVHPNPLLEDLAERCPAIQASAQKIWATYSQDLGERLDRLVLKEASSVARREEGEIQADPFWRLWMASCLHVLGSIKRRETVIRILAPDGMVGGDERWKTLVGPRRYLGSFPYGQELFLLYARSAFLLDVRQPQAKTAPTQRVFDGPLCSRPVLAEWSDELEELFDVGSEIVTYRNIESAMEGKRRLLKFPKEASLIGERARKRVLACHTYRARAGFMLRALFGKTK